MTAKRIDPETGVFQEDKSDFGGAFGHNWVDLKNEKGKAERINPETGVHEEDISDFGGLFGYNWRPK